MKDLEIVRPQEDVEVMALQAAHTHQLYALVHQMAQRLVAQQQRLQVAQVAQVAQAAVAAVAQQAAVRQLHALLQLPHVQQQPQVAQVQLVGLAATLQIASTAGTNSPFFLAILYNIKLFYLLFDLYSKKLHTAFQVAQVLLVVAPAVTLQIPGIITK
jgi:hypothetical protein